MAMKGEEGSILSGSAPVSDEELKDAARRAFADLPENFQEVLGLLQDQDLSLNEAAARLGKSREAVKKLYGRALAELERRMGLEPETGHGRRRPTR
jgi:DNA-directed RNA polymerase specialized sigma24 family protein